MTQEDDQVISVISLATRTITYRYGVPGTPGAGPDHLFNPDDAMVLPGGGILSADIKNCRIVIIAPPAHTVTMVIGQTTNACEHDPPHRFGSPNGACPMTNGHYLVTEINGGWANEMAPDGHVSWSARPPGCCNHRVVVVDPATKRIVWQYGHTGTAGSAPGYLNDPDGVDLVPPDSLLITHAATMGTPWTPASCGLNAAPPS